VRGAFFGILGARALHRLVFLTELVVQLERTPRGIVLGDDGLERDDHAAAAKRREQRVELRTGKTAEHEHLVGKAALDGFLDRGETFKIAEIADRLRKLLRRDDAPAHTELEEREADLLQPCGVLKIVKQCTCHGQTLLSGAARPSVP